MDELKARPYIPFRNISSVPKKDRCIPLPNEEIYKKCPIIKIFSFALKENMALFFKTEALQLRKRN